MKKPLVEQGDKYNQRLTLSLETKAGEMAMPLSHMKALLRTQSLEAWNGNGDGLRDWLATQMADYFSNLEIRIWCHSN